MDLSVIENDPKEVKKYLQNFVPINYYRVLDDAYLYQVRAILLHSVSHADSYNPIYAGLINDLTVTVGNNHVSYTTSIKAVVDNVSSLITKTEKLEAETSTSIASIETIQEVYASDKEARATEVKTLTAAIKDIVIGGRNIMKNSDFSRGYREWQEASIEPLEHFIGKLYKVRSTGIVGSLMGIYPLEEFQNMAMVEGTQYSVSFYAYGSIMLMDEIYLTSASEAPIKLPSVVISTDLSERRHITFKAPTGGGGLGLIIGATATKEDDWFNIGKVKVELGNRPTDWTPAPEDVDGYIARVQSVITEFRDVQVKDNVAKAKLIEKLDSRVDDNAATVKRELETQVTKHDALAKRTETVEANTKDNKAKIETVETAFTDEKSATAKRLRTLEAASALGKGKITVLEKVTADTDKVIAEQSTTLNAKIDNISSGGRNLLKNADFKLGVDTWGTSKITKAKNILGNLLTVTNTGTTTDYYGLQPVDIFRNIKLLENKEYVLSFYAKGNIPTINDIWITSTGNLPQQLSNAEITTGIADRTEIVFTAENTSEESSLLIGANGYAKGSWFAVVAVKLELGNKATDWTIAPEDTGEIIEQVEANIEAYKKAQALINLATAEDYKKMNASVGENKGELERLDSLVVTNEKAIGTINTKLEVEIGGNIAKIIEDYKVVSSDVGAMGTKLDGVYAQTNPVMMGSEEVMIGSEKHYAGVWTETGARIEQGLAQSFRTDVLESSIDSNRALIKEEAITRVNALGSLSALTTKIQANTENNTSEIKKLMITVTTPESGLAAVVTELKAVVAENTTVGKATKKAAEAAAKLAGNKGEVIFSNVAPSKEKELPQNLWIDTSEDLNTPKRWAGGKWLVVTDFAAKAAQKAANKAQKDATDAIRDAKTADDKAVEAQRVAGLAFEEVLDISSDSKITPSEKEQLKVIVNSIEREHVDILSRASKYKVSTTEYVKTYTALTTYVATLLKSMSTTSEVVRKDFNAKFDTLFLQRANLNSQIIAAIKLVSDTANERLDSTVKAVEDVQKAANAAQETATKATKSITDASLDNKLTPVEKKQIKIIWSEIVRENSEVLANAAKYSVTTTDYTSAYNLLRDYLTPLLVKTTESSDISRTEFNSNFDTLFLRRASLNTSIVNAAKEVADEADSKGKTGIADAKEAKKVADLANGIVNDITNDNVLTPSEKEQVWQIVESIKSTHISTTDYAVMYGVPTTTYSTKYNSLITYINGLLSSMTTKSVIDRTVFNNKFTELYDERSKLDKVIRDKAKSITTALDTSLNPVMIGSESVFIGDETILLGVWSETSERIHEDFLNQVRAAEAKGAAEQAQESADEANTNLQPQNLSRIVEGSGAFATKFGAIAGQYSKMEGVIEGQRASIETYTNIGNLEALKNEIAKERLNKNIEGLDAQKAKLTTAIADFNAQITLLNTKIAETEDVEVINEYRNQVNSLQTAIVNANAEKSIIDDNKRQLATEVRQLKDLEIVKDKTLLASGIKMTGPKGKVKGIGLLMEDTGYTNFDIIVDSFSMSVDETSTSIKPFKVNGTGFEVNVPLKANSTITTPSIQGGSITGTSININNKFKVSAQGDLVATSGTFGGIVTGGSINIANKFKVDTAGNMTATSGKFSGDITGASGRFTGTVLADKIEGKVANIENAAVDTLQIADFAVTIPRYYNNPNKVLVKKENFGEWVLLAKATFPSNGSSTSLNLGIEKMLAQQQAGNKYLEVGIFRNGIEIKKWTFESTDYPATGYIGWDLNFTYFPPILDTKTSTGEVIYEVKIRSVNFTSTTADYNSGSYYAEGITLTSIGMRK